MGQLRHRAVDAVVIGAGIVRTALDQAAELRRRVAGAESEDEEASWGSESSLGRVAREEPDSVIVPEGVEPEPEPETPLSETELADESADEWAATLNGAEPSSEAGEPPLAAEETPLTSEETPLTKPRGAAEEAPAKPRRRAPERDLALPPRPRASLSGAVDLRFTRTSDSARLPERAHDSDAGLDLFAAEAARIGPGQRVSVGTGLSVAIPEGHTGLVLPRSGLALKHGIGLVNAPGLIDSGYRGELRVLLLNTDQTSEFRVAQGDRIAQLLLVPVAQARAVEADDLESTVRGSGGFGSSGL